MLFQYTWEAVIAGRKTQTRRLIKGASPDEHRNADGSYERAGSYAVGQTVPVMPARGVKGLRKVADIRITRIERQDVRDMNTQQAQAEGADSLPDFMATWCSIHDPLAFKFVCESGKQPLSHEGFVRALEERPNLYEYLSGRPNRLYAAWTLHFELVHVYDDAVKLARERLADRD